MNEPETILLYCDPFGLGQHPEGHGSLVAEAALVTQRRPCAENEPAVEILAAGAIAEVERHPASVHCRRVHLGAAALVPGFVNAHTHLDLTAMGPRPYDPADGFMSWASTIVRGRPATSEAIAASVAQGAALSLAGGVVAVGDIATPPKGVLDETDPAAMSPSTEALRASPLMGVSFVEFFGLGVRQAAVPGAMDVFLERVRRHDRGVQIGLQPHAPYTAGLGVYDAATQRHRAVGVPLSTHLAEHAQERRFVASGDGPVRETLAGLGMWDDEAQLEVGGGGTPIAHLARALDAAPWLLAHVNDADDTGIGSLAAAGASVAYCPRSSAYFSNERDFGPHRYAAMRDAGVRVVLGTDSIVNLPACGADAGTVRMSVLDEARLLYQRDSGAVGAAALIAMCTVEGAAAIGLDQAWFTLAPGRVAGVVAVGLTGGGGDICERILRSGTPPELLVQPEGFAGRVLRT